MIKETTPKYRAHPLYYDERLARPSRGERLLWRVLLYLLVAVVAAQIYHAIRAEVGSFGLEPAPAVPFEGLSGRAALGEK